MKEFNYITNLKTEINANNSLEIIHDSLFPVEIIGNPTHRPTLIIAKKKSINISHDYKKNSIYYCQLKK